MVARKGYAAELSAKHELQEEYGEQHVIKVAIGQIGGDFLCLTTRETPQPLDTDGSATLKKETVLDKVVEVKKTSKPATHKGFLGKRSRQQLRDLRKWCRAAGVDLELWVKHPREPFKVVVNDEIDQYIG